MTPSQPDSLSRQCEHPEIGTVLGIICNVRDAIALSRLDVDDLDHDAEIEDLQRAVNLLKPMVFSNAAT